MMEQSSGASMDVEAARPPRLPASGWPRLRALTRRALTRRCPYCGAGGVFTSWWSLRDRCPSCNVTFEREHGYFLGAYALNLIFAQLLGVAAIITIFVYANLSVLQLQIIGVTLVIAFPVFFFPYSRSLWMALDLMLHPLEPQRERE